MLDYAENELGLKVHRRGSKATASTANGERAFQL